MILSFFIFGLLFSLSGGLIAGVWFMAARLSPVSARRQGSHWLVPWSIKGLAIPALLWMLMNVGISWNLQPFMPQIQMARNRGLSWAPEFMEVAGMGIFVAGSYWTAVTLGWALFTTGRSIAPEPRKDFKALCWTCFLGLIIPAVLLILFGGW